ncbi:MAG: ATP-binding cassette domain-containing protein [Syntrophorhabdaceae bacterium]|nr:ATP-binding cassette domain-containing protein [Syntrophorhabdaceae bacterium]
METPLIEFVKVTKRFGDKTVLNNIDLKIYGNQITTIIGKSGTGKSVLLKHIIGLLEPDEGEVLFQGRAINRMNRKEKDAYKSRVSYLFQNNALFDSMTVFENVAFPLIQTTDLGKREIKERVMKRMEELELTDALDKYPSELSGGMQKRVALARALITDPEIVLFDEPTTGQDPIRKNMILSMITHYKKKFGFTAVMISHDIPDVFFISDRIIILWDGRIGFEGTYEEAKKVNIPLIDEFLRSLEGFEDELTGLISREVFRVRYSTILGGPVVPLKVSAVLFSIRISLLEETIGPQKTMEVLRMLGEYINTRFSPIGAFSARYSRDEILTIFPHTDVEEAEQLVYEFAQELKDKVLANIKLVSEKKVGEEPCFDIHIHGGVVDVSSSDTIDQIVEKARARQRIIAIHRCENGR